MWKEAAMILPLFFLILQTPIAAYPTGAGACVANEPSVMGPHLSSDAEVAFDDHYAVLINDNDLSAETFLTKGETYVMTVVTKTEAPFRGALIRLQGTGILEALTNGQLASGCGDGAQGVTHTSSEVKTEFSSLYTVDMDGDDEITLDLTVVESIERFAYKQFKLPLAATEEEIMMPVGGVSDGADATMPAVDGGFEVMIPGDGGADPFLTFDPTTLTGSPIAATTPSPVTTFPTFSTPTTPSPVEAVMIPTARVADNLIIATAAPSTRPPTVTAPIAMFVSSPVPTTNFPVMMTDPFLVLEPSGNILNQGAERSAPSENPLENEMFTATPTPRVPIFSPPNPTPATVFPPIIPIGSIPPAYIIPISWSRAPVNAQGRTPSENVGEPMVTLPGEQSMTTNGSSPPTQPAMTPVPDPLAGGEPQPFNDTAVNSLSPQAAPPPAFTLSWTFPPVASTDSGNTTSSSSRDVTPSSSKTAMSSSYVCVLVTTVVASFALLLGV